MVNLLMIMKRKEKMVKMKLQRIDYDRNIIIIIIFH